ncbi:MAG: MalY/PatB family protein [Litorilinea sp.]
MAFDFDTVVERRGTDSAKWNRFGDDVLPMWVADMDFPSPPAVIAALHKRIEHGFFGYSFGSAQLSDVICERLAREQQWEVTPDDLVYLPGLVCGLNIVTRAVGEPGDGVLVNTPVYPPFLSAPTNQGRTIQTADMALTRQPRPQGAGEILYYTPDLDALQAAVTDETRLFILCNPHNPVGREFTRDELTQLGEFCVRNNLTICSDEIHADLLLGDTHHTSIAGLDSELADQTITLLAPSKTFNLPGLGLSVAVIQNEALRTRFRSVMAGIVPHPNILGYTAALTAYTECDEWLTELRAYLTANRDYMVDFVTAHFPHIPLTVPEATYLGWLDLRGAQLGDNPADALLETAKVAVGNGADFGAAGQGFVRINFGCPRALLQEGLERIGQGLRKAVA